MVTINYLIYAGMLLYILYQLDEIIVRISLFFDREESITPPGWFVIFLKIVLVGMIFIQVWLAFQ